MKTYTVIIPCYNDAYNVQNIVNAVLPVKKINQIVVVDDGSTQDQTKHLRNLKNIELHEHKKNRGKSAALLTGLEAAKNERVFFLDADLKKLTSETINKMISRFEKGNIDMLMGYVAQDLIFLNMIGYSQAYTGQRIIRSKTELIDSGILQNSEGYMIESEMNKYYFRNKNVEFYRIRKVGQQWKIQKKGLKGLKDDFEVNKQLFETYGIREVAYQVGYSRINSTKSLINNLFN